MTASFCRQALETLRTYREDLAVAPELLHQGKGLKSHVLFQLSIYNCLPVVQEGVQPAGHSLVICWDLPDL